MKSIFHSTPRSRRAKPQPQHEAQAESPSAFFQPKLTINAPNDQYEREADAVADQVVNEQSSNAAGLNGQATIQRKPISQIQRLATPAEEKMPATNDARMAEDKMIQEKPEIQRMDAPKEEEKPVQKMDAPKEEEKPIQKMDAPKEEEKPIQKMDAPKEEEKPIQKAEEKEELQAKEEKEEPLQTKSQSGASQASPNFSARLSARKGQGSYLPKAARAQMEQGIGADFSQVRIHTDSEAVDMNKEISAQAFTHGQDVYFNQGKFSPESTDGKRLLAHELVHTIQQGHEVRRQAVPAPIPIPSHLSPVQEAAAIRFNRSNFSNPDAIRGFQALVGAVGDGIIGRETSERIAEYQLNHGLVVDGMIGAETMRVMIPDLIARNNQNEAIFMIVDFFNFNTTGLISISFDAAVASNAVTSGAIPGPSTVRIGPAGVAQSYEGLVHTIEHELEHVRQRRIGILNQDEREFLGEAIEITSTITPEEDIAGLFNDARRALTHWNRLIVADQRRLWTRFEAVRNEVRIRFNAASAADRATHQVTMDNYNNTVRP